MININVLHVLEIDIPHHKFNIEIIRNLFQIMYIVDPVDI